MTPDPWTARCKGASFCNANAYAPDCNTPHRRKERVIAFAIQPDRPYKLVEEMLQEILWDQ